MPPKKSGAHWWYWFVPLVVVVLCVAVVAVRSRPGVPSRYRVEPGTLIISDDRGRELWRKQFAPLEPSAYTNDERVWFGDLDGTGAISVVFLEGTSRQGVTESLIAYDTRGRERWRFTPSRTVRTSTKSFAPPFHPERFLIDHLGRAGLLRIAVTSTDHLDDPSQVALLDNHGHVLREYWHSGHLQHLLAMDLDHRGWKTLIVAGISNPHKTSTLLVLDPDHFTGASKEDNPSYQLQDLPPPVETARVLFPRSCINERLEPFTTITRLWQDGDNIAVEVQHRLNPVDATIFYRLNQDLSLHDVTIGTSFESAHLALHASGIINHDLTPAETAKLGTLTHLTTEH